MIGQRVQSARAYALINLQSERMMNNDKCACLTHKRNHRRSFKVLFFYIEISHTEAEYCSIYEYDEMTIACETTIPIQRAYAACVAWLGMAWIMDNAKWTHIRQKCTSWTQIQTRIDYEEWKIRARIPDHNRITRIITIGNVL